MCFSAQPQHPVPHSEGPNNRINSRQAERNEARALQHEQVMFAHRSRYLVLVLTLNYQPAYRQWITLEIIQQHRDRLLNNGRNNKLLQGIEGYVWKIEEGGMSGGLHLHLIIYYSGKHQADVQIARSIGEYWKHAITDGIGDYWNSNADRDFHARFGHGIGTGQIDRNNHAKREALRINLRYLAKEEQQVTCKTSPYDRMFGTSQPPRAIS